MIVLRTRNVEDERTILKEENAETGRERQEEERISQAGFERANGRDSIPMARVPSPRILDVAPAFGSFLCDYPAVGMGA